MTAAAIASPKGSTGGVPTVDVRRQAMDDSVASPAAGAMRATSRSGPPDVGPGVSVRPFEAVVADHGPVVLRVVRALLGPADADDAWWRRSSPRWRPIPGCARGATCGGGS